MRIQAGTSRAGAQLPPLILNVGAIAGQTEASGCSNCRGGTLAAALAATAWRASGTQRGAIAPATAAAPAATGAFASLAANGRVALKEAGAAGARAAAIAPASAAISAAPAEASARRASRPASTALDELRLLLHHRHLQHSTLSAE